jgi:cation diffusion facilitator CzcD-associated flavoprotein CzcO
MKREGITKDGYIAAQTVHEYLTSFAEEFDLTRRTRLRTRVVEVNRTDDGKRWVINVKVGVKLMCDKLIYATGPTSNPIVPTFPSEGFDSPVVHSQVMGERLPWIQENCKRTTVIGGAKSAFDTVYMLIKAGQKVDWVIRDSPSGPMSLSAPTFIGYGVQWTMSQLGWPLASAPVS